MLEKNKYSLRNITNPQITKYIDQKYKPINQKLWRMRLDSESKYIPIIQRDVETMLISYLFSSKPKKILELGTAIGYSSIVMADTMEKLNQDCEIVTVERNPVMIELATENIKASSYEDKITIIDNDAIKALDSLVESVATSSINAFDFVFVDAGKSHYMEFWERIEKIVKPGGIVFCDNIFMRGMTVDSAYDIHDKHRTSIKRMREFLDYLMGIDSIHTTLLPVGDGVTVSYFKEN